MNFDTAIALLPLSNVQRAIYQHPIDQRSGASWSLMTAVAPPPAIVEGILLNTDNLQVLDGVGRLGETKGVQQKPPVEHHPPPSPTLVNSEEGAALLRAIAKKRKDKGAINDVASRLKKLWRKVTSQG